ncbi:MAG TPA: aldehyde dehydrogenase family protein [Acidimicrobiales bacterium]|nr:aldehyde dehydrogenase family protein [Acidimicrobiales bacterium]
MVRRCTSVIAGRPVEGHPGGLTSSTNPAHLDDVVAEVALGDPDTFVRASLAAKAAQPSWAGVPAPVRGRVIAEIGRIVEANKEGLARLVTREVGKPLAEARGEVQEIIDTCDLFLGEGRRLYGETVPSEMRDKALFTFRMPVGAVAVVTAGNFPVAVPSWYLLPALLCGNTVVWKPAEYSAGVATALYECMVAGGVPDGVLNLVLADGITTFEGLRRSLDGGLVDKVGFTGSSAVGSLIGELCGRHLQAPCLELGGKNPMVVMPDADLDLAVDGALFAGFGTAGQRCTSLGTAIVHESLHDEFVERLVAALEAAPIGDPEEAVLYGPMLDERFAHRFEEYLSSLVRPHHRLCGGSVGRISSSSPRVNFVGDPDAGIFYHPVLVDGVRVDDDIARTETFGPLVGIARFVDFDEALAFANCSGYGLSASIYTTSAEAAFHFRSQIGAGMVSVNNSTSGAEAHLPFGGNGKSGNGSRQSGKWVLDQMTRWQSVNWDFSGRLQKAQMDTDVITADRGFHLSWESPPLHAP